MGETISWFYSGGRVKKVFVRKDSDRMRADPGRKGVYGDIGGGHHYNVLDNCGGRKGGKNML